MELVKEYCPKTIDFTIKTKEVPLSLGKFKSESDARKFIAENTVSIQTEVLTERFMDKKEIETLRTQYATELEDVLPEYRTELMSAASELESAKEAEKQAKEMVNSSINKVQSLANAVKSRVTDISLDKANTYEIAYNGKYYYYSFIDGELKLAKINDIPSYKAEDLLTSSEHNAIFFETKKEAVNG